MSNACNSAGTGLKRRPPYPHFFFLGAIAPVLQG